MDRPTPSRAVQRRVQRAVLSGERLDDPDERRAAVEAARRWRARPLRAGLPTLTAVVAGLVLLWGALRVVRPPWLEGLATGGGLTGALVGVAVGWAIMLALLCHVAKRAEESNRDA